MKCLEVQRHLSAWLDGEVQEPLWSRLSEHLEGCAACRAERSVLERLEEALGSLEAPQPAGLADRVLARLPRQSAPWWKSMALAASILLGVALGGALTGNFFHQPDSGNGAEVAVLEVFQDFPQDSWGNLVDPYEADEDNNA